jgi:hypothetical protein
MLKDSASHWIDVVTTAITGIARPFRYFVVLGNLSTGWAVDAVRVEIGFQPPQTGIIIGKIFVKLCYSISSHFTLTSPLTIAHFLLVVKG